MLLPGQGARLPRSWPCSVSDAVVVLDDGQTRFLPGVEPASEVARVLVSERLHAQSPRELHTISPPTMVISDLI